MSVLGWQTLTLSKNRRIMRDYSGKSIEEALNAEVSLKYNELCNALGYTTVNRRMIAIMNVYGGHFTALQSMCLVIALGADIKTCVDRGTNE